MSCPYKGIMDSATSRPARECRRVYNQYRKAAWLTQAKRIWGNPGLT